MAGDLSAARVGRIASLHTPFLATAMRTRNPMLLLCSPVFTAIAVLKSIEENGSVGAASIPAVMNSITVRLRGQKPNGLQSLIVFSFLAVLASPWCAAQNKTETSAADTEWAVLINPPTVAQSVSGSAKLRTAGLAKASTVTAKQKNIEQLVQRADQFHQFRLKYPQHAKAAEAKCQEAVTLFRAGLQGDSTQESQRNQLVVEIRADKSIAGSQRCSITAYAENLKIMRRKDLSPDARLDEFERVARALIAEFPELPAGYESLLGIACMRSDEAGLQVAKELAGTAVPEPVKQQVCTVIYRQSLIGKPVLELVATMPGLKTAFEQQQGHPILLYTWSVQSPPSVALAQKLSSELPPKVGMIGLNLDDDVAAAKASVDAAHLRGEHCFAARATAGVLTMHGPGLIFIIDEKGLLTSVSAQRNLANIIKGFATP